MRSFWHIFCVLLTLVAGISMPHGVMAGSCALPEVSHCCQSSNVNMASDQGTCCQGAKSSRNISAASCCQSKSNDSDSTHDADDGGCCSTGQCPCCSSAAVAFISLQSDETLTITVSSLDCADDVLSGRSDRPTSPPPKVQV